MADQLSEPCYTDGAAVITSLGFGDFKLATCAWALIVIYFGALLVAFTILAVTARREFMRMKSPISVPAD